MQARLPVECVRVQSRLFDLFDNSLSSQDREHVEGHLSTCLLCAKEWETVRVAERSLRTSSYSLPVAGDLRPQFYARLQAENRILSKRSGLRPVAWWGFAGVAACAIGLFMFRVTTLPAPTASTEVAPGMTAKAEKPKPEAKTKEVAVVSSTTPLVKKSSHPEIVESVTDRNLFSPPKKVKAIANVNGKIAPSRKSSPRGINLESMMITEKAVDSNEALALLSKANQPQPAGVVTMTYHSDSFGAMPEGVRAFDIIRANPLALENDDSSVRSFRRTLAEPTSPQTEEASFSIRDTERDFEAEAHIVGNTEESDGTTVVTIDAGE